MNNNKNRSKHSLNKTIKKMVPAVFTALVATGIGFVALYTSPVPMIQDFGKMLTIGLIVSFILGVFILIPILFIRDYFFDNVQKKKSKHTKQGTGKTDKMLNWLTEKTIKLRWVIIAIAVILAAIGIWVDVDANAETDVETFMPQNTQELKDIHKLRDIVGTTDQVSIVYEGNDIISDDIMIWVDKLTEDMGTEFPDVVVQTKSISNIVTSVA